MDYPLQENESWWMISPNDGKLELKIPIGAPAVCTTNLLSNFKKGFAYEVVDVNDDQGWISVMGPNAVVEMPRYIFARYFDAIPFIRGGYVSVKLREKTVDIIEKGSRQLTFEDGE